MKAQTGFKDLDIMLGGGFEFPSLVCLASRTGMGKTTLMLNIMENMKRLKQNYTYFSLENSKEQICRFKKLIEEKNIYDSYEFRYVDSMIEKIEWLSTVRDPEQPYVVFVDSLEMLEDNIYFQNSYERKKEIILKLKKACLDNKITIVISSDLSRKVDDRIGHRPILTDLRDCGSIESLSDVVILILRREYYDANDKPSMAELIFAKNKYGGIGTLNLIYIKSYCQFCDYTPISYNDEDDFEAAKEFKQFLT